MRTAQQRREAQLTTADTPTRRVAAPHAAACCPASALAALSPADLAALDAYCARSLDDPDAEPQADDEAAAVARYDALLAERARAIHVRGEASR